MKKFILIALMVFKNIYADELVQSKVQVESFEMEISNPIKNNLILSKKIHETDLVSCIQESNLKKISEFNNVIFYAEESKNGTKLTLIKNLKQYDVLIADEGEKKILIDNEELFLKKETNNLYLRNFSIDKNISKIEPEKISKPDFLKLSSIIQKEKLESIITNEEYRALNKKCILFFKRAYPEKAKKLAQLNDIYVLKKDLALLRGEK